MTPEEIWKQWVLSRPQKSAFSKDKLREKFIQALNELKAEYSSLKLSQTDEPLLFEVVFEDEKKDLILKFNELVLNTLSDNEIEVMLLHEGFHVITLTSTYQMIPDVGLKEQEYLVMEYLQAYDEYRAHIEFVNKYKEDNRFEAFIQFQKSRFSNFEIILSKHKIFRETNSWKLFHELYSIYYDSVFFLIINDDSFNNWCIENNVKAIYQFFNWIYQDFNYIKNIGLTYKEEREWIIQSGVLSWSVNPFEIIYNNRLIFAETTKKMHEDLIKREHYIPLVKAWENRRIS